MRVPLSWLREHAALPEVPAQAVAARLIAAGLEVEAVETVGADVSGVVVGQVLAVEELTGHRKPVRYCTVDVGDGTPRGIVCGATNVAAGQRVPVALPGAGLPGGVAIGARKAYGRLSEGMICSARELGVGSDADGILVLPAATPVGADAVSVLRLRDDVLDIAVTPDRGYCWSVRGVAREAALAFDVAFTDPAAPGSPSCPPPPPDEPGGGYEVTVRDRAACDRYVARVVHGLDPSATTPVELQRRLLLAGMRPISLAVDVTNYVLLDLGQPLHAFDAAALTGGIEVRRARAGERLRTLDGVERVLDPDDLVIADGSGPIALAGVLGGGPTEVGPATTEVVLEAAHFDPAVVARTARRHRVSSEASRRFERGVDDALAPVAADAAVRLLRDLGGAAAAPGVTDVDSRRPRPTIRLGLDAPGRVAGRTYEPATVRRRLADVGCGLETDGSALLVAPPSWRPDLLRPIDLVDEVIRLEGYDTVPTRLPAAPAGRGLNWQQRQRRRLAQGLAAAGYVETPTYPFMASDVPDLLGLDAGDERRRAVAVANPIDDTAPLLRTTLLPGLLAALARNVARGFADLALYELGAVFLARPEGTPDGGPAPRPPAGVRPDPQVLAALDAALPHQPLHVAAVLTGARESAGWWGPARPAGWPDAVDAGRRVARLLGCPLDVAAAAAPPWHPGRCAAFRLPGAPAPVGYAGELHPRVLEALALPPRTVAVEIDVERILQAGEQPRPAPRISAFPLATVDVALVVDDAVPAGRVEAALRAGAGHLLESVRLFDVYRGAQIPTGHKSLAFALRLRAPDRTLGAAEVAAVRDAAVRAAGEATGAQLRAV